MMVHPLRRCAAGPVALGLLAVGGAVAASCSPAPHAPRDTDARIAFYEARLGGRATYPAYAGLGLAYLQKARETGAVAHLDAAKRFLLESQLRQPNYAALRGLAAVHLARHEFGEALRAAEEATETQPADAEATGALFDALLALGEEQKAADALQRLQQQSPGFAAEGRAASLEEYRGRLGAARDAMRRACSDAERGNLPAATRAWCRVRLGALFVTTCEADQAERLYREALTLFPDYYLARQHLAELAAARGQVRDAQRRYEDLLAANPSPDYQLALADLHEASGESSRAEALRSTALATLRGSAQAGRRASWRTLALLLLADDATIDEGLRWAERDWKNRRDPYAADTLAWAYFRLGRLTDASALLARALQSGIRTPSILLHAAEIAWAGGRRLEVTSLLSRLPPCRAALSPSEHATRARLEGQAGF